MLVKQCFGNYIFLKVWIFDFGQCSFHVIFIQQKCEIIECYINLFFILDAEIQKLRVDLATAKSELEQNESMAKSKIPTAKSG